MVKCGGKLIEPSMVDEEKLSNKKSVKAALLCILRKYLQFSDEDWLTAIKKTCPKSSTKSTWKPSKWAKAQPIGRITTG
jgi:hypothetical protein